MAKRGVFAVSLLLLFLAITNAARSKPSSKGPAGAIIAVAKIDGNATGSGKAVFNWYNNQGSIKMDLKGSLTNMTMAHIHLANATLGNPIVTYIFPKMTSPQPVLLNPPVSYKNHYHANATFTEADLAKITPGMTAATFLKLLKKGLLYVNVHTTAQPGGAIQGTLVCRGTCTSNKPY